MFTQFAGDVNNSAQTGGLFRKKRQPLETTSYDEQMAATNMLEQLTSNSTLVTNLITKLKAYVAVSRPQALIPSNVIEGERERDRETERQRETSYTNEPHYQDLDLLKDTMTSRGNDDRYLNVNTEDDPDNNLPQDGHYLSNLDLDSSEYVDVAPPQDDITSEKQGSTTSSGGGKPKPHQKQTRKQKLSKKQKRSSKKSKKKKLKFVIR